jgi:hypothetical protein
MPKPQHGKVPAGACIGLISYQLEVKRHQIRTAGSRLPSDFDPASQAPARAGGQLSCLFCCTISFRIIYLDLKKSNSLALLAFEPHLRDALWGAAAVGEQSCIAGASIPIERNPISGTFVGAYSSFSDLSISSRSASRGSRPSRRMPYTWRVMGISTESRPESSFAAYVV